MIIESKQQRKKKMNNFKQIFVRRQETPSGNNEKKQNESPSKKNERFSRKPTTTTFLPVYIKSPMKASNEEAVLTMNSRQLRKKPKQDISTKKAEHCQKFFPICEEMQTMQNEKIDGQVGLKRRQDDFTIFNHLKRSEGEGQRSSSVQNSSLSSGNTSEQYSLIDPDEFLTSFNKKFMANQNQQPIADERSRMASSQKIQVNEENSKDWLEGSKEEENKQLRTREANQIRIESEAKHKFGENKELMKSSIKYSFEMEGEKIEGQERSFTSEGEYNSYELTLTKSCDENGSKVPQGIQLMKIQQQDSQAECSNTQLSSLDENGHFRQAIIDQEIRSVERKPDLLDEMRKANKFEVIGTDMGCSIERNLLNYPCQLGHIESSFGQGIRDNSKFRPEVQQEQKIRGKYPNKRQVQHSQLLSLTQISKEDDLSKVSCQQLQFEAEQQIETSKSQYTLTEQSMSDSEQSQQDITYGKRKQPHVHRESNLFFNVSQKTYSEQQASQDSRDSNQITKLQQKLKHQHKSNQNNNSQFFNRHMNQLDRIILEILQIKSHFQLHYLTSIQHHSHKNTNLILNKLTKIQHQIKKNNSANNHQNQNQNQYQKAKKSNPNQNQNQVLSFKPHKHAKIIKSDNQIIAPKYDNQNVLLNHLIRQSLNSYEQQQEYFRVDIMANALQQNSNRHNQEDSRQITSPKELKNHITHKNQRHNSLYVQLNPKYQYTKSEHRLIKQYHNAISEQSCNSHPSSQNNQKNTERKKAVYKNRLGSQNNRLNHKQNKGILRSFGYGNNRKQLDNLKYLSEKLVCERQGRERQQELIEYTRGLQEEVEQNFRKNRQHKNNLRNRKQYTQNRLHKGQNKYLRYLNDNQNQLNYQNQQQESYQGYFSDSSSNCQISEEENTDNPLDVGQVLQCLPIIPKVITTKKHLKKALNLIHSESHVIGNLQQQLLASNLSNNNQTNHLNKLNKYGQLAQVQLMGKSQVYNRLASKDRDSFWANQPQQSSEQQTGYPPHQQLNQDDQPSEVDRSSRYTDNLNFDTSSLVNQTDKNQSHHQGNQASYFHHRQEQENNGQLKSIKEYNWSKMHQKQANYSSPSIQLNNSPNHSLSPLLLPNQQHVQTLPLQINPQSTQSHSLSDFLVSFTFDNTSKLPSPVNQTQNLSQQTHSFNKKNTNELTFISNKHTHLQNEHHNSQHISFSSCPLQCNETVVSEIPKTSNIVQCQNHLSAPANSIPSFNAQQPEQTITFSILNKNNQFNNSIKQECPSYFEAVDQHLKTHLNNTTRQNQFRQLFSKTNELIQGDQWIKSENGLRELKQKLINYKQNLRLKSTQSVKSVPSFEKCTNKNRIALIPTRQTKPQTLQTRQCICRKTCQKFAIDQLGETNIQEALETQDLTKTITSPGVILTSYKQHSNEDGIVQHKIPMISFNKKLKQSNFYKKQPQRMPISNWNQTPQTDRGYTQVEKIYNVFYSPEKAHEMKLSTDSNPPRQRPYYFGNRTNDKDSKDLMFNPLPHQNHSLEILSDSPIFNSIYYQNNNKDAYKYKWIKFK